MKFWHGINFLQENWWMSQHWIHLELSWINVILCSFSADKLDLMLFATRPVVENMHSSTKISSRYSWRPIEMLRNSAAETFYGGFTASKIRRLIRRAIIFLSDFRRTNIRRRIRRSAAAEGSMTPNANYKQPWLSHRQIRISRFAHSPLESTHSCIYFAQNQTWS